MDDVALNYFSDKVRTHFKYLVDEYNFLYHESCKKGFSYYIDFVKKGLMVSVQYTFRNNYIQISMFRDWETKIPTTQDFKNSVSLLRIIKLRKKDFDIERDRYFDVKDLNIDVTLSLLSILLKRYAADILEKSIWIDSR